MVVDWGIPIEIVKSFLNPFFLFIDSNPLTNHTFVGSTNQNNKILGFMFFNDFRITNV